MNKSQIEKENPIQIDTRISYCRRDTIRVEIITDENFNKEKRFISNITNKELWTIKLELPFVEKNIHNYKLLRDKVLIDYSYVEDQYKKDKKIKFTKSAASPFPR